MSRILAFFLSLLVSLSGVSAAQNSKTPSVPKAIAEANASVKLGIPQGARVLLREVVVFVDNYPDPSLRAFVEPMLKASLTEAGFTVVATAQEVRREAEERRFERESEEVHKGSLPPKGTILRETVELKATVHLVRSARQLGLLLGELRRHRINIGGFYIRKNESGALVFLEIIDNATLTTTAQLVSFATNKDETFTITGTPFGAIVLGRDNQRQRDMTALKAALGHLSNLLKMKLEEREPIKGKVLGKVEGVTSIYIAINVGRLNGVQKGMKFAIHPVRKVGEELVALPPIAKIRVLVVNDTNSVCDVVEGKLEEINEGDEAREIFQEVKTTAVK
ncbi:MAG: hypothetical protein N3B10_02950 [Armatimonadetes bacterium]|nr:hypothetical protein [Armatimonadota bacterium]MCX7967430.1 hypothetical protein [Armatimonadota bacterium]MDW8142076.1 hypothetical protein [Armatimonadota bacterium]